MVVCAVAKGAKGGGGGGMGNTQVVKVFKRGDGGTR